MTYDIIASIVLYKNDKEILTKTINSFLNTDLNVKLILVDNSPTDILKKLANNKKIEYLFNHKNLGFGKAHNIAIKNSIDISKYYLVLNPDIYFEKGNIEILFNFMNANTDFGQIMPKILYPNGDIQYLCKRNPTFFDLFIRRFLPKNLHFVFSKRLNNYEYRNYDYNNIILNVPYFSGCFMFFRTSLFKTVGYFDERIFMYIEDADITRRFLLISKNIYYPMAEVFHHFEKGSHKKIKLMLYSIHGAIIYFNKWGWFNSITK